MTPAASGKITPPAPSSPESPERVLAAIDQTLASRQSWLIDLRRRIHAAPEPSGGEHQTTGLIAQTLCEAGLQPRIMADGLGVIVDLDLGAPADRFIALRAELDCVKVNDDKPAPYASRASGLCHACGHDAHASIVLAAVLAVLEHRPRLRDQRPSHNLRAVFQPAEETATGALSMIEQGALKNVQAILAVHVDPFLDAGVVGLRKGPLTSACKAFEITITGRSGHSARPFQAIDPIPAAVMLTDSFYQLCPRSMDSRYPLALTVASINAGSSFNAIPDQAIVRGTLRTSRREDLDAVQRRMEAVIRGVAEATGCAIEMHFAAYAPPTNNDDRLIDVMAEAAADIGAQVNWIDVPSLGAEDFAFYQEVTPGAIVRLGAAMPKTEDRRPLHSSQFDIDERALLIGARFLAHSALRCARD